MTAPRVAAHSMSDAARACERCGDLLDPKTKVYLELNCYTGIYTDPDKVTVPGNESQGLFWFGRACAKRVLASGGCNIRTPKGGAR